MNDEYEGPLTAGAAQTHRRIAGLKIPRAEHQRDEKATRWNRIWLPTMALFLTLCALIYLDELLDLPHLVLGAPRTPVNWQEATLEVAIVAAVGLLAVSRLRRDVAELKRAEAARQTVTARYKAILVAVPDIIVEVDANKVYTWANQAGFEFFGEDVLGQEAAHYFEGEQDTYDVVQPLFDGDENVTYIESWQRRKDGEKRLLAWWCRVLKDAHGNATGALSTARDITERQRAGEALRKSEERFRQLAEALPQAICETDATGTITYANHRAFDLFGYNPEDLEQDLKYLQMIAVRDRERARVNAQAILDEAKGQTDGTEYVGLRKDGSEFPLVIYSAPLVREGRVLGMRNVIADISERKRAEEALHESKERFRRVYEHMAVGVAQVSLDYRIEAANEAYCHMLGYDEEELVGKYLRDITHPETVEENLRQQAQLVAGEIDHYRMEKQFVHKSGHVVHGILDANLVRDAQGKPCYCLGSVLDITERKQAEEALRRSEALLTATQRLARVGGWEWDVAAQTMTWTEEAYHIHDIEPGEIAPLSPEHITRSLECYDAQDRPAILAAFQSCAEQGEAYDIELPFTTVKGRRLWIRTAASAVLEQGRVVKVVGHIMDITKRKRAEEELQKHREHLEELVKERTAELRQSEEQSRAQYKGIPVPTYTWQKVEEDFVLADYNDAAEEITRGKIADFVGIEASEMYRDMPGILDELRRCHSERTSIEREMPYRLKSTGESKHLAVKYAFVPPDRVLVHTEDVTERVRAEEEIRKHAAELKRLVNLMAGREVRMAELKQAIHQLRAQLEEAGLEPAADDPLLEGGT